MTCNPWFVIASTEVPKTNSSVALCERLYQSHTNVTTVWRGSWPAGYQSVLDVVAKISQSKEAITRLSEEAQIYSKKLSGVQGLAVPWFFGFYTGTTSSGVQMACMLLEYCGKPMYNVRRLDWKYR